ncbi:MFS transporter [Paraburkholderia caffeinilytica]|uniref:MFS transporter n=1 Tax=Paraburkholderia caffeinilytica TaxID=1761016 RepID=UPI0038B6E216
MSAYGANVAQRLDALETGPFHWRLLGLIGGGMFFDAFDNFLAGSVLGALVQQGLSDMHMNALFISMSFAGLTLGAWGAGVIGDRFGRRFSYQFNLLIFGLTSIAAAFAPSMTWLIVLRFIMGIGLGAEIVVGYSTLNEFMPAHARGRFASLLNLVTNSSVLVSAACGFLIIPHFGWRWMFAIPGIGALVIWYLRKKMPESPRWLAAVGRHQEAREVVEKIEAQSVRRDAPLPVAPQEEEPGRLRDLFAARQLSRTVVGISVICISFTAMYAFVAWVPTFLVKQGFDITHSLLITSAMFAGGPAGSLISMAIADRIGRKWGLVIFSALGAVIGMAYPYVTHAVTIALVGFGVTTCIYVTSALGVACYVTELFPTRLRLRGVGLANAAGRAVNVGVPYVVAAVYALAGLLGVVSFIAALFALLVVILITLGVETKQRTLEEVQAQPGADSGIDVKKPLNIGGM